MDIRRFIDLAVVSMGHVDGPTDETVSAVPSMEEERSRQIRLREVAHGVKEGTFSGYAWLRSGR